MAAFLHSQANKLALWLLSQKYLTSGSDPILYALHEQRLEIARLRRQLGQERIARVVAETCLRTLRLGTRWR